jgi:PPE-repeat protein
MTAPVWMASPPEVHSALLSSGPGPGSLLAAAGAWNSLSTEYASIAEELSAILAAVQAGAWQGPSAERYLAAHVPYLAWLVQASAKSASEAVQHETAAAAYTAALAEMPTLPELAANHVIHGVWVATNFFGINTIPIALNEADYVRMWIQAATTMATYQAVATTAVASAPQTDRAPQIQQASSNSSSDSGIQPIIDDDSGNPYDGFWYVNRVLEITQTLQRDFSEFFTNPSQAIPQLTSDISGLIADETGHVVEFINAFQPELIAAAVGLATTNFGAVGGFAGFAGLAGLTQPVAPVPAQVAPPVPSDITPAAGVAPAAATATAPATSPATIPAPTASAVVSSAPPPPPAPPAVGPGFAPPYAVGPPGIGFGSGMGTSAGSGAKKKGSEPEAAAAAAAAAREHRRPRRRRRAGMRGYGDEFMEMNINVDPDWGEPQEQTVASDQGVGALGFAGTVRKETVPAAGLTTLSGDEFGGGPAMPMVPGSWNPDQAGEAE